MAAVFSLFCDSGRDKFSCERCLLLFSYLPGHVPILRLCDVLGASHAFEHPLVARPLASARHARPRRGSARRRRSAAARALALPPPRRLSRAPPRFPSRRRLACELRPARPARATRGAGLALAARARACKRLPRGRARCCPCASYLPRAPPPPSLSALAAGPASLLNAPASPLLPCLARSLAGRATYPPAPRPSAPSLSASPTRLPSLLLLAALLAPLPTSSPRAGARAASGPRHSRAEARRGTRARSLLAHAH
jgi:hypothetical protein